MVLILTIDFDQNTTTVINWLLHYNSPFIRVNETDFIEDIEIVDFDIRIKLAHAEFWLSQITGFWYRRGAFAFRNPSYVLEENLFDEKAIKSLNAFKNREISKCIEYLYVSLMGNRNYLGDPFKTDINKLVALSYAKAAGLNIPGTVITDRSVTVQQVLNRQLITKPISEVDDFNIGGRSYRLYTEKIDSANLPENFSYSQFQEEINKKFEIRSFYLDGSFFSMAIFSQNDTQTQVDFRRYNRDKPNRNVPYQLPPDIERKLNNVLVKMGYDTASIDLILDTNDEHYFLEINPIGQFGMTSYPCNYYLEEKVALYLIKDLNQCLN